MSAPAETPVLRLGRRIANAEQQMRDHDQGGKDFGNMPADCASRINGAACEEYYALAGITCDLPAETLTDALVQLGAAATLMESLMACDNGLTRDPELAGDCARIERAIAGAIRVLLEVPGAVVDGLDREDLAAWPKNKWPGELPPVRVGEPVVRRCVPRMDEGGS